MQLNFDCYNPKSFSWFVIRILLANNSEQNGSLGTFRSSFECLLARLRFLVPNKTMTPNEHKLLEDFALKTLCVHIQTGTK